MKKYRKLEIFLVLGLCLTVFSCDIFNPKKFADVILVDGPRYEDEDKSFSFTGTVRNIGDGKALFVRVYIDLFNPNNEFLAQSQILVDKTDLDPGESSAWRVTFDDEGRLLRDLMDESKTNYDITWTEAE
jgi:hypothetical protein